MTALPPALRRAPMRVHYREIRPATPGDCTHHDALMYLCDVPEAEATLRWITGQNDAGCIPSRHRIERRPDGDGPAAEHDHIDTLTAYGLIEDAGHNRHTMFRPTVFGRRMVTEMTLQALLP